MNTIETVQALVSALEAKQWPHGDGFDRIEIAAGRELLAQMQAAIGEQVLKRLDPTLDVFAAQSPAPAAPTFDEWWENHGKYNALFKFDHNASPSDRLARANELMSLSWEVARESPAPVAVQPSQWQDIATAPKDGRVVLYCDEHGNRWPDCSPGHIANGCGYPATLWQALPPPPLSASPEDKP